MPLNGSPSPGRQSDSAGLRIATVTYVGPCDRPFFAFTQPLPGMARGTSFERRMTRSRVSNGMLCTILVAAMSWSAGSLSKSRRAEARATARSSGHICMRFRTRLTSRSSRSMSIRPRSISLANSQRTIAATDHLFWAKSARSAGHFPVEREDQHVCVKIEHRHSSRHRLSKCRLEF